MPDFLKIERPIAPPTVCITCSTHACPEGFVDTGRDVAGYGGLTGGNAGHIYVCAWCASSMAKVIGFVDGEVHAELLTENQGHVATIEKLRDDLVEANDRKLVSLADLEKIISGRKLSKAS